MSADEGQDEYEEVQADIRIKDEEVFCAMISMLLVYSSNAICDS